MTPIELAISNVLSALAKTSLKSKSKDKKNKTAPPKKTEKTLSKFNLSRIKENTENRIRKLNKEALDTAEKSLRTMISSQKNISRGLSLTDNINKKKKKRK